MSTGLNIGIDAGSLCVPPNKRFGTYTFSYNLIQAFTKHDRYNTYHTYAFCKTPIKSTYVPSYGWSRVWLPYISNQKKDDVFLALNQYIPKGIRARPFVFLHGLSYIYYKELYPDSYARMKRQLRESLRIAEHIFVTSRRIVEELNDLGYSTQHVHVLPVGIPYAASNLSVRQEFKDAYRLLLRKPCFVFAGMNHPIKNIEALVYAISKVRKHLKDAQLILFGTSSEWEDRANGVYTIQAGAAELQYVYRHATAYVSASLYESLHFPILESLTNSLPVIAFKTAVIDELRPFVTSVRNKSELAEQMVDALKNNKKIIKPDLRAFNWKKTITTITKPYNRY